MDATITDNEVGISVNTPKQLTQTRKTRLFSPQPWSNHSILIDTKDIPGGPTTIAPHTPKHGYLTRP
ncbi:MAG: hypothetical protein ACK5LN_03730, partial [Propioniciclava sp.]